jgi:hypothetical protein
MKHLITILLIFISVYSKCQKVTEDSLKNLYLEGTDYFGKSKFDSAYLTFSKIIQLDSSYYKIYYLRAYCNLISTEKFFDNKGKYRHEYGDSTLVEKGIIDFKKCIKLYFTQPKVFPESVVCFDHKYKLRPKKPKIIQSGLLYHRWELHDLEFEYGGKSQNIIEGVLTYITSNGKNKKLACDCWQKALKKKVYKIEILLNEFCK